MDDLKKGAEDLKKNVTNFWSNTFSTADSKFKGHGHKLGTGEPATSSAGSGRGRPVGAPGTSGSAATPVSRNPSSVNRSGAAAERILHDRHKAQQQDLEKQKEERRQALLAQQQRAQGGALASSQGTVAAAGAGGGTGSFDPFSAHFTSGPAASSYATLKRQEQASGSAAAGGAAAAASQQLPATVECPVCGQFWGAEEEVAVHVDSCLSMGMASEAAISQPSAGGGPPTSQEGNDLAKSQAQVSDSRQQESGVSGQSGLQNSVEATGVPNADKSIPQQGACPTNSIEDGAPAETKASDEAAAIEEVHHATALLVSSSPAQATVDVLRKLLANVLADPRNDKFRRVRLSNPKIAQTVGSAPGALAVLAAVGFVTKQEGGEEWAVMGSQGTEQTQAVLREALGLLPAGPPPPPPVADGGAHASPSPSPTPSPSDAAAPKAKFDRQVRVFLSTSENSAARIKVPDSFYERSAGDVRQELASRRQALESSQVLMTRAMREKQKEATRRRYRLCVIRVLLPDGLVLQGLFRPWEPTSAIYEFMAGALKDPTQEFQLMHSVPLAGRSSTIPSVASASSPIPSLEKEDLVPASLIKFRTSCLGPPGYTGLERGLLENVEPLTSVPLPQAES